jgi:hypothetical protein
MRVMGSQTVEDPCLQAFVVGLHRLVCSSASKFKNYEGVFPETAWEDLLPEADVVVITGSVIDNGTIERLPTSA